MNIWNINIISNCIKNAILCNTNIHIKTTVKFVIFKQFMLEVYAEFQALNYPMNAS